MAYFNGGLFAEPARVELRLDELGLLKAASKEDWSKVRPEIFGTSVPTFPRERGTPRFWRSFHASD